MKTNDCYSSLFKQLPSPAMIQRIAGGIAITLFLMATGIAAAQLPAAGAKMDVPDGYKAHQTVDVGGHVVGLSGSGAMYDTLVDTQSGPRVLGETFELRALPGNTHSLVDSLHAVGNGFGGDPNSFAGLTFEKGKSMNFRASSAVTGSTSTTICWATRILPGGQTIAVGPPPPPALRWPGRRSTSRR